MRLRNVMVLKVVGLAVTIEILVLQIFFYKFLLISTGEHAFSFQEPQGQNIPFCTENLSCHLEPMEILAAVSTSKRSPKVDVKG